MGRLFVVAALLLLLSEPACAQPRVKPIGANSKGAVEVISTVDLGNGRVEQTVRLRSSIVNFRRADGTRQAANQNATAAALGNRNYLNNPINVQFDGALGKLTTSVPGYGSSTQLTLAEINGVAMIGPYTLSNLAYVTPCFQFSPQTDVTL